MTIREKIGRLLPRLATERQYATQGETLFVDLERQEVQRGWIPRRVAERLLGGRGVNMFLLHNLLNPSLEPLHPEIPLGAPRPADHVSTCWARQNAKSGNMPLHRSRNGDAPR